MTVRRIIVGAVVGLILGVFSTLAANAEATEWTAGDGSLFTYFYKEPDPKKVEKVLHLLRSEKFADSNNRPPMIGWLSSVFRAYPERVPEWVEQVDHDNAVAIVAQALWYAGREDAALAFFERWKIPQRSVDWLKTQPTTPMAISVSNASHLDILWGAYMGSGDLRYVEAIFAFIRITHENPISIWMTSFSRQIGWSRRPAICVRWSRNTRNSVTKRS